MPGGSIQQLYRGRWGPRTNTCKSRDNRMVTVICLVASLQFPEHLPSPVSFQLQRFIRVECFPFSCFYRELTTQKNANIYFESIQINAKLQSSVNRKNFVLSSEILILS